MVSAIEPDPFEIETKRGCDGDEEGASKGLVGRIGGYVSPREASESKEGAIVLEPLSEQDAEREDVLL